MKEEKKERRRHADEEADDASEERRKGERCAKGKGTELERRRGKERESGGRARREFA